MDKVTKSLLLIAVCLLTVAPASATTWDLAADWQGTQTGVWSYGFLTPGYPMVPFAQYSTTNYAPFYSWEGPGAPGDEGYVWEGFMVKNPTEEAVHIVAPGDTLGIDVPAGGVAVRPEFTRPILVRWTAPYDMPSITIHNAYDTTVEAYMMGYVFTWPLGGSLGVLDAAWLESEYDIYGNVAGPAHLEFNLTVTGVKKGDWIDFALTSWTDPSLPNQIANMTATVTGVPEPSAIVALFSGLVGFGGLVLRRKG